MTVGLVGVHYPEPEYFDEFISRVHQAVETMSTTPGCLSAACWVTVDGGAIVTTGQWESEEALKASFAIAGAAGVDFAYDERERLPRDVFHLRSL
ncbi:putative quinol monooxygenase [Actinomadura rudentiformis]|uniref:ABM domain-containing protein n=1 Tax=Actinomadura rudentiformis TaxID=359158 RepID=A0A6H9YN00_9ACTN|nr:antibiotic biosynthesis monooxygenase [Actinomadura rudentiformis]KAB2340166.1 hypothetical protein F8566_45715 [Actinomadura rudentiformis]